MSVTTTAPPVVGARAGVGDWGVWWVQGPGGLVRCKDVGGLTEVLVGDADAAAAGSLSFAALACTRDGGVEVVAHAAPPALLISPRGCRLAPAQGGSRERLAVAPEERVLVLSAAVLDPQPTALTHELQRAPGQLSSCRPGHLLGRLFHEIPHGAGVVLARRAPAHDERSTS